MNKLVSSGMRRMMGRDRTDGGGVLLELCIVVAVISIATVVVLGFVTDGIR